MSLYRGILAQAWKNTWTNKYLWFFGLFAAMLGSGSELNLMFNGFDNIATDGLFPTLREFVSTGIFSRQAASNFGHVMISDSYSAMMVMTMMVILFMLLCFLVWFAIVSQIAIVNNYSRIIGNKSHNLNDGLDTGIKKFFPIFGINALVKIAIYLIFIILAVPIVFWPDQTSLARVLFFIIAYIIFIPVSVAVSFVAKYAIAYGVIKGQDMLSSIKSGWELFAKNWLVSIEMAFILFGISFVTTIVSLLALALIAIPLLFLGFLLPTLVGMAGFWLIFFSGLIIFVAVVTIVGSALSTFQISSWTGLFIELITKGGVSKIVRIFSK